MADLPPPAGSLRNRLAQGGKRRGHGRRDPGHALHGHGRGELFPLRRRTRLVPRGQCFLPRRRRHRDRHLDGSRAGRGYFGGGSALGPIQGTCGKRAALPAVVREELGGGLPDHFGRALPGSQLRLCAHVWVRLAQGAAGSSPYGGLFRRLGTRGIHCPTERAKSHYQR